MDTIRYTLGGDYDEQNSSLASSPRGSDFSDQNYNQLRTVYTEDKVEFYLWGATKYPMPIYTSDSRPLLTPSGVGVDFSGKLGDIVLNGADYGDWLRSGSGDDVLNGGIGDDVLDGGPGGDILDGGDGRDTANYAHASDGVRASLEQPARNHGEAAGDTYSNVENITGSAFADVLVGDVQTNRLEGGAGDDRLDGGSSTDIMIGGSGNDVFFVDGGPLFDDEVHESSLGGQDTVYTIANYKLLQGEEIETLRARGPNGLTLTGNEIANAVVGGAGGDRLDGAGGADRVRGGDGLDTLAGGDGNDRLDGGTGDDTLTGGAGHDQLFGRDGADRFVFASLGNSVVGAQRDAVNDFSHKAGDRIDLSQIDANTEIDGIQDFTFIGTAKFGRHAGELHVVAAGSALRVEGDVNGDAKADFSILVRNVATLQDSDFVL